MSRKGGQTGVKDGRVHTVPHDTSLNVEFDGNDDILGKEGLLSVNRSTDDSDSIQDGVEESRRSGEHGSLQLSLSDSEDNDAIGHDEMDSFVYEREVVANNAQWLKKRCTNFEFSDVLLEKNELFDGQHIAVADVLPLCSDTTVLPSQDTVAKSCEIVTFPCEVDDSKDEGGVHVSLPDTDPPGSGKDGVSDQSDVFRLDFNSLPPIIVSKSGAMTLMTPQELESLPNRGLDFEESIVPANSSTDSSNPDSSCAENAPSSPAEASTAPELPETSTSEPEEMEEKSPEAGAQALVVQPSIIAAPVEAAGTAQVANSGISSSTYVVATPTAQAEDACTFATISISTDKNLNSTQIVVNTSQGQQLYLINTADLQQATNALQPLGQPIENIPSVPPQSTPATQAAAPLQWQNTGFFLVPNETVGNLVLTPPPALPQHAVEAHTPRKIYMCYAKGCDKVFRKHSKLKIHQMRHTGERPFKCTKPQCDWAFTTAYKLKRHEESHEGRKDYICDVEGCDRKFTTVYNLNSHKKLHKRPCKELCREPGCGLSFPTKRQLDVHMRVHTGKEKTYKCPVEGCDKVFFSPNCMGSHARVHLLDREELKCTVEGCGKVFDKQCRLKQHMRRHTGEKPYACTYEGCTWAFTTASKLNRHMSKHTGIRKWSCSVCHKGFMRAEHLKEHQVTHSGQRPYCCPVEGCANRFTAKSSLYVHLKKHDQSGKKITYFCPMEGCNKHYSAKASLCNHIVKHYLSAEPGSDTSYLDLVPVLQEQDMPGLLDRLTKSPSESGFVVQTGPASLSTSPTSTNSCDSISNCSADFTVTSLPDGTMLSGMTGELGLVGGQISQLLASSSCQIPQATTPDSLNLGGRSAKLSRMRGHIRDLFAALGSDNLETLKADIRNFKGKDSLRRTLTRDNSAHRLSALAISHAIQTFDQGALRRVSSVDRSQPLHMYALAIGDSSLGAKSLTPSQPRRQSATSSDSGDASIGHAQSSQESDSPALDSRGRVDGHFGEEWEDLSQGADSGLGGSRDVTLTSEVLDVDVSHGASESPVDTSTMSTLPDVEMDSLMGEQVEQEANGPSMHIIQ